MRVITIKRTVRKGAKASPRHRSVRQFAHDFFATENHWHFAIEALIFGVLLAISALEILAVAGAINQIA